MSTILKRTLTTMTTRYKLIFYTPLEPCERIKSAIFATGAGTFPGGKYSHCSFESTGTGQFLPVEGSGARPAIGDVGRVERVEEKRVEIMCVGEEVVRKAVVALKREHPYEEVAYEVYKMEDF